MCVCVYVHVCTLCVCLCVCVCEREREREVKEIWVCEWCVCGVRTHMNACFLSVCGSADKYFQSFSYPSLP